MLHRLYSHAIAALMVMMSAWCPPASAATPTTQPGARVAAAIEMLRGRVESNPRDFLSYTMLARLHLRAAEGGHDPTHAQHAEAALRRALAINPAHTPAKLLLAAALSERHRFADALELAREVLRDEPENTAALNVAGDAHLAMGDYPKAEHAYAQLRQAGDDAAVLARLAHLAQLRGRDDEAMALMQQAVDDAYDRDMEDSDLAWFIWRLGDIHFSRGQFDAAQKQFESALRTSPDYEPALAGMAMVRFAQNQLDEAIAFQQRAVRITPDLHGLATLGDLYASAGDVERAKRFYEQAEQAAVGRAECARDLALFYCDHDMKLDAALELARQDMAFRQDIHAYDTLAWALFKNNKLDEAADASAKALSLGTQDANLFFHAGMIHTRRGEKHKAREYLERALSINPFFSPTQAAVARQTLAGL